MSVLIWNPLWQLTSPAKIALNDNGSMTFKGPIGEVFLPDEYLQFMSTTDGAALRDKGSFFAAQFASDATIFQIEWLGTLNTTMFETWDFYLEPSMTTYRLPKHFISIGYAEPCASRVVLCADQESTDYGKVFSWIPAHDPWMTGDNTRGLGYVADSFNEFMNGLKTAESMNHLG